MAVRNDSGIAPEQQRSPNRVFADAWCEARAVHFSPVVFDVSGASFVSRFRFRNYDYDGNEDTRLSIWRHDRKEKKYTVGTGVGSVIYSPYPDSQKRWESEDEVWIAEGEGKTLALHDLGLPVLGVRGCWSWQLKGARELHPMLARLVSAGKRVNIVFDADWRTNPNVHRGLYACMEAIRRLGAIPVVVGVPEIPGIPDAGIDDLIAMWKRAEQDPLTKLRNLERLPEIENPYVVNFKEPYPTAENFIQSEYGADSFIHWQGDFYVWVGTGWQRTRLELIRERIYRFCQDAGCAPKSFNVNQIVDAARAVAQIDIPRAPAWLDDTGIDPDQLLACKNGLLDLTSGDLLPHTPEYFNLSWSEVEYDPDAECPRWMAFLSEIYPDDPTAADTLQEFVGYTLTTDTSQQKAIALIGPKRSGKGTIARSVQALLGADSYCAPTLASMGKNFGLQTWIGKRAAFVADARASTRNNAQQMVERILTVTGEDTQFVDRKNKEPWEGRLNTRLWLLSNQLPATQDTGAALVSRFLLIEHSVSFYAREDTELEGRLRAELSGILNWALVGLKRMQKRGRFVQPQSGKAMIAQWERLNSPMKAFVEDMCELDPEEWVPKKQLREAYKVWCFDNDIGFTLDDSHFTNNLNSATDHRVRVTRKYVGKDRVRVFSGIRLRVGQPGQPNTYLSPNK